jgi:ethanolamine utilization protein EutQ (cupin superfamily)
MAGISVFHAADRPFEPYLGEPAFPEKGRARIVRLIGQANSSRMAGGVVIYEKIIVDWNLPFDEMITVIEGRMSVISGGGRQDLVPGDVAWFPAGTPLRYEVADRVTVSYAIWPQP